MTTSPSDLPDHNLVLKAAYELDFPPAVVTWLQLNWGIWEEFYKIAEVVRAKGRGRFGAFAVINVIRWNRMVSDTTQSRFKIANSCAAPLARLYNRLSGVELFETRNAPSLSSLVGDVTEA